MKTTLTEWLTYLEKTHKPTSHFGLEPVREVEKCLNLNQTEATVITITGTNGKGSCAEMLTSAYVDAGYQVGTYTSPHLFHFNERIRIQKKPIDDTQLCEAFEQIEQAKGSNIVLTYFAFITLAALWIFKQRGVQIIILEVGIGGRLDATNVLNADLAIISSIGLDHREYLGNTRESVAQEKAGILRPGQLAVCGDPMPPATLVQTALKLDTHITYISRDFHYIVNDQATPPNWSFYNPNIILENLPKPILAINNAAVVLQAILLLKTRRPINVNSVMDSIINTKLRGRCEIQTMPNGSTVIFDVAHNPHAVAQLVAFLQMYKKRHPVKKVIALFSMLADKDIAEVIKIAKTEIDEWHTAEIHYLRAAPRSQLLTAFETNNISPLWHDNLKNASDILKAQLQKDELLVVFGSFFIIKTL